MFGNLWPVLTKPVIRQRRADPECIPVVRWVSVQINRIWESLSHPYDLRFGQGFFDNSWFAGFDQAETLAAITCPTTFLKATTRYNKDGILLAALSDEDLARVEELLPRQPHRPGPRRARHSFRPHQGVCERADRARPAPAVGPKGRVTEPVRGGGDC